VTEAEAATLVGGLAAIAGVFVRDEHVQRLRLTDDLPRTCLRYAMLAA
jgi:hypothetical protein